MFKRAAITWAAMIPVAIANGVFRETVIAPVTGDLAAHQISVVTGALGFLGVTWGLFRRQAVAEADGPLLKVGAAWVIATIAFEFGFGHYLDAKSWSDLFHDYYVAQGRLWPVVLLVILFAPLLVKRIAMRSHADARLARPRHA